MLKLLKEYIKGDKAMKFNDFKYERPNYNNVKNILEDLILELEKADTWNDA